MNVTIVYQTMLTCNVHMYNYVLSPYKISLAGMKLSFYCWYEKEG